MKLEEIYTQLSHDFPITGDLGQESLRTADLFVKYIKLYNDEKLRYEAMDGKRKILYNKLRDYYSGHADPSVYKEKPFDIKIKTEQGLQRYIEADPDMQKFDEQVIIQKQKVFVLENCLNEVHRRGYSIRASIDHAKFQSGA